MLHQPWVKLAARYKVLVPLSAHDKLPLLGPHFPSIVVGSGNNDVLCGVHCQAGFVTPIKFRIITR